MPERGMPNFGASVRFHHQIAPSSAQHPPFASSLCSPTCTVQILAGLIIGATPLGHFFLCPSASPAPLLPSSPLPLDPLLTPVTGVNGMGLGASLATALAGIQDFVFGPLTAGMLHPVIEVGGCLDWVVSDGCWAS